MLLKIHERMERRVVALCDKELVGNVYEQGDLVLDLRAYKDFYAGKIVGEKEAKKHLEKFDSANIVGKKSIALATSLGLCKISQVKTIAKIPHIQIYKF